MSITRYRHLYAVLLRLYPARYRESFAEGMEQTFNDLLRERQTSGNKLGIFALWMFVETIDGITRAHVREEMRMLSKYFVVMALVIIAMLALLATYLVNGADDGWFYAIAVWCVLAGAVDHCWRIRAKERR